MQVWEARMKPKGAFHIGERGIGYEGAREFLPADTLFGALCAGWTVLFGETEMICDLLPNGQPDWSPPFLLSSAFPFAGSVRFYPKPHLPPPDERIRWREVKWVSEGIWTAWLQRKAIDGEKLQTLHDGAVALLVDEVERLSEELQVRSLDDIRLWAVQRTPRVVLDAVTHASSLYHFGRLLFRDGCGLFFLVCFLREGVAEKFWTVMRFLGDHGVGGDRTAGHGAFSLPQPTEVIHDFCQPCPSQFFVTLSPFLPKRTEVPTLFADGCRYRLTVQSGWLGGALPSSFRHKVVRMVEEGSVLCGSADQLWGTMVEVTPSGAPHAVYRWGYAFPVACEVQRP